MYMVFDEIVLKLKFFGVFFLSVNIMLKDDFFIDMKNMRRKVLRILKVLYYKVLEIVVRI